ncbi:MAG: pilus assembly protein PilP [Nitrospirae bacterium]|nr:pilus assembly protein PilP [Nitrospirota bacterium]
MMKKSLLVTVVTCSLGIMFIACGDKQPAKKPQPQATTPPAAVAAAPATPQNEIKAEKEIYVYDPKGRRDPFIPLIETGTAKEKPVRKKGSVPIENFDVDEIRVIAIAWDSKQFYAMVTLPDKKSYTVRKGMTLGLYGGKVREITRDSVIITEQIKDYKGQLKTKDTILKLRKEEEE